MKTIELEIKPVVYATLEAEAKAQGIQPADLIGRWIEQNYGPPPADLISLKDAAALVRKHSQNPAHANYKSQHINNAIRSGRLTGWRNTDKSITRIGYQVVSSNEVIRVFDLKIFKVQ